MLYFLLSYFTPLICSTYTFLLFSLLTVTTTSITTSYCTVTKLWQWTETVMCRTVQYRCSPCRDVRLFLACACSRQSSQLYLTFRNYCIKLVTAPRVESLAHSPPMTFRHATVVTLAPPAMTGPCGRTSTSGETKKKPKVTVMTSWHLRDDAASSLASDELMFMDSAPSVPFTVTWKMHFPNAIFANQAFREKLCCIFDYYLESQ